MPDDGTRAAAIAAAVQRQLADHPGVSALEPTLASALLGDHVDGVVVKLHGDTADVDISIRTHAWRPARESAGSVHAAARAILDEAGLSVGTLEVAVLAIDR